MKDRSRTTGRFKKTGVKRRSARGTAPGKQKTRQYSARSDRSPDMSPASKPEAFKSLPQEQGPVNNTDVLSVPAKHGLSKGFSRAVEAEAASIAGSVSAVDTKRRVDLRDERIFTIDGADAKDFDDAVSVKRTEAGGYCLGVHIADVSHYVGEDSEIDREALQRGTSIYLIDQVVPMLPLALSNGICSLNPYVDRLTLTIEMQLDSEGAVLEHDIYESVINSKARLFYSDVSDLIEKQAQDTPGTNPDTPGTNPDMAEANQDRPEANPDTPELTGGGQDSIPDTSDLTGGEKAVIPDTPELIGREKAVIPDTPELTCGGQGAIPKSLHEDLFIMTELAEILRNRRLLRGSIDFELDEAEIELDENGFVVDVKRADRRVANKMIEEFMLLANETVAVEYNKRELPFVYRIHEKPDREKLADFKVFLNRLGFGASVKKRDLSPYDFASILKKVKNRPFGKAVNVVMLRTMQKACYDPESKGHFGLASEHYCHFTSPIRRYPDLMIHRIIKECMRGRPGTKRRRDLFSRVAEAAAISSETERRAMELEREVEKIKKAEYMSRHIGEEYDGVICGVVSFGFFVELPNTVEGLVGVYSLTDDYYEFEYESLRLIGESTNKTYNIGDEVRIVVDSVSLERREIDFRLVQRSGEECLSALSAPVRRCKQDYKREKLQPANDHQQ